jgi:hypothetical protein
MMRIEIREKAGTLLNTADKNYIVRISLLISQLNITS